MVSTEDYVIDMIVEVGPRGVDLDLLARRLAIPGVELLTTTGDGLLWLTAVLGASGESAAVRTLQDGVLGQLSDRCGSAVATVLASAPLGELYGQLDPCQDDDELCCFDLVELVAQTLWREPIPRDRRHASVGRLASSA